MPSHTPRPDRALQLGAAPSPSEPPSSPPPSPPPLANSIDKNGMSKRLIAVVVAGLGRTLNHHQFQMNFKKAIAEPLQPDVFIAISHDAENSTKSVDQEIKPFTNMLRASTTGYIGWKRMALPDDELHRYMYAKSAKGIPGTSEIWDLCLDKRNYMQLQWRTLSHAFDMVHDREKDMGSRYHAVIRTRTDLVIERVFPPPEILFKALGRAQLLIPWASEQKASNGRRILDDQFAVMTRAMASLYFSTYDRFECGHDNEDLSHERKWCNQLSNFNDQASECYLGETVYNNKGPACIMTFDGLFGQDVKWVKHLVTECGQDLCMMERIHHQSKTHFHDGEEGTSITPKEMNMTKLLMKLDWDHKEYEDWDKKDAERHTCL